MLYLDSYQSFMRSYFNLYILFFVAIYVTGCSQSEKFETERFYFHCPQLPVQDREVPIDGVYTLYFLHDSEDGPYKDGFQVSYGDISSGSCMQSVSVLREDTRYQIMEDTLDGLSRRLVVYRSMPNPGIPDSYELVLCLDGRTELRADFVSVADLDVAKEIFLSFRLKGVL